MIAQTSLRQSYQRELAAHGYQADAAQSAAIERLEALRTRLLAEGSGFWQWLRKDLPTGDRPGQCRGVYLWGGVGRGKTWLMDLLYDSLPPGTCQRSHFHHFMRNMHQQLRHIGARRDPLQLLARRIARQTRLLCLDEFYVSDIVDAMLLGGLLEALLRRGVLLVITSNLPPIALYRNGLQRERFLPAIALLERELEVLAVDGGIDYRLRQLQRHPIYLDSRAADSARQLQSLFDALAGDHGENTTELRIAGRRLRALRRRGDVVWFAFATLCEEPRSANDYVDIASEFHTVLVSDVPAFTEPQQDNEARRFIALVDELYDQGVKLLLSAAAAPADLYRGERLQLEFRRTASRLVEMQTEFYLARPIRNQPMPQSHTAGASPE
ncbi:MAG: cell division protein ZapE [Steroidobacterales bacterium]